MVRLSDRDVVLLFVDALNRVGEAETPILISDLQAQILEAGRRDFDVSALAGTRPTVLFHLLQQLVEDDLLARTPTGYVVTEKGRQAVDPIRAQTRGELSRVDDAAAHAVARTA